MKKGLTILIALCGPLLLTSCLLIRGKVSGRVLLEAADGSLAGVPAVHVELVDMNGNRIDTAFSEMNGDFTFDKRVKAGRYKCRTISMGALGKDVPVAETEVRVYKSRAKCDLVIRLSNQRSS